MYGTRAATVIHAISPLPYSFAHAFSIRSRSATGLTMAISSRSSSARRPFLTSDLRPQADFPSVGQQLRRGLSCPPQTPASLGPFVATPHQITLRLCPST
jgi:hypothetical protein